MTVTPAISTAAIFAGLAIGGATPAHADQYRADQHVGEAGAQAGDGLHTFWATQADQRL
jgi:hypothetical protein